MKPGRGWATVGVGVPPELDEMASLKKGRKRRGVAKPAPAAKPKVVRHRVTYAFGIIAFVPHPHLRGLYLKTHVCVDIVVCPVCDAAIHEPCRTKGGASGSGPKWGSDVHWRRKDLVSAKPRYQK